MNKQQLWHYVPLSDYSAPQATISRSIKGGIRGLWQRLRGDRKIADGLPTPKSELQGISKTDLEHLAPDTDWQVPAGHLKSALDERISLNPNEKSIFLVVGLPQGGNAEILTALAKKLKWSMIKAPSAEQILSQDHIWLKQMKKQEGPWVIPALERCYLRHVHGLGLVRQLFEKIDSKEINNGIIGCDSWALAYLKHVLPGRLPEALVAQAFDDHRLSWWFNQKTSTQLIKPVQFCQADNGELVLPIEPEHSEPEEGAFKASAFINQLADHSYGIPRIARHLWKKSLKREPDKTLTDKSLLDGQTDKKNTIWVLPWDKLDLPSIPSDINPESLILLHSLLLHNGLSQPLLSEILPCSNNIVTQMVLRLKDAGLIEENDGWWTVSPSGYPIVRRYLNGEGYLTDQF